MFLGTHYPRLDDKGRLALPAKYRDQLKSGLVVTKGQENSLAVYPTAVFEQRLALVEGTTSTAKVNRDFRRGLLAAASDQMLDKQGRITIPQKLREYAGLERDVAVLGQGNFIEIWDAKTWERYESERDADFSATDGEVIFGET